MIKSATGLKAKVRNISKGDSKTAQAIIRIFFMERLLERISLSKYKDQFVLKGGMLVSSLIGIDLRTTMDIDTTVKAVPLSEEELKRILLEICEIQLEDNISFQIVNMETIMDDFDYPGIRIHLEAFLEKLKQPIKIDVSTDDTITPGAIEYKYPLLFEEREICLNTYNIETLLAEKSQTIISRGLANTRMRDFYDLYEIAQKLEFSRNMYRQAFAATCKKRETIFSKEKVETELKNLSESKEIEKMWNQFKLKNCFVENIQYCDAIKIISDLILNIYS